MFSELTDRYHYKDSFIKPSVYKLTSICQLHSSVFIYTFLGNCTVTSVHTVALWLPIHRWCLRWSWTVLPGAWCPDSQDLSSYIKADFKFLCQILNWQRVTDWRIFRIGTEKVYEHGLRTLSELSTTVMRCWTYNLCRSMWIYENLITTKYKMRPNHFRSVLICIYCKSNIKCMTWERFKYKRNMSGWILATIQMWCTRGHRWQGDEESDHYYHTLISIEIFPIMVLHDNHTCFC